jgi:leader peptidase (prepilin peptidase)/N-methyltransferase
MEQIMIGWAAAFGVLGLIFGSFFNVVAIRLLKQESIVHPPSHCVHCKHRLGPLDLVPVLSYMLLRGRCRYCQVRISPVYAIGEGITALLFASAAWWIGYSPDLIAGLLLASVLVIIVQTDLREMIIPNKVVYFGMGSAVALRFFIHPLPWWDYALAFLVGGGLFYGIAVATKGGMGGGDIKLFAFLGIILGLKLMLLTIFLSSLAGTLYGIVLMLLGRFKRKQAIPFGPFIAVGAWISYLWGDLLLSWYLSFL